MTDEGIQAPEGGSTGKWILLALAALYVAGSLYFIFDLRGRLDKISKDQATSTVQLADLGSVLQKPAWRSSRSSRSARSAAKWPA